MNIPQTALLEAGRAGRPSPRYSATRWVTKASNWLFFAGAAAAALALGAQSLWLLPLATTFFALGFATSDIARVQHGLVTPITLFALGAAVTGLADVVGLAAADTPARYRYFVYTVDSELPLATRLAFAGALLPIIGFRVVARSPAWASIADVLPRVRMHFSDRALVIGGALLGVAVVALRSFARVPDLGTLTGILFFVPSLVVFTLARVGARRDLRHARYAALLVATLESIRALWFAYLRGEILMPIAAFAFGILLGARSIRPLRSPLFLPVYVLAGIFALYFGRLGEARSKGGVERLVAVYEMDEASIPLESSRRQQTLLSRVTTFNQLSQIGYLVKRDGFRNGKTLDYLGYAFIPRFLWPEKPAIAKGAWFALEIGQAYQRPDGRITNSVAMTIPGELYLNFGWPGVVLGCLIFGGLVAVFWTRTRFWQEPENVFGSAFGFYLLWTAFGLGADLQLIVTTTAVYLMFVGVSIARDLIAGAARSQSPVLARGTR
jgi:hypothetical protein